MINLDQLKADRAAGTQGPLCGRVAINGSPSETIANGNRIARTPDLEAAFIEAFELLEQVEERSEDREFHGYVKKFLERFK